LIILRTSLHMFRYGDVQVPFRVTETGFLVHLAF
jgi:hypothetical protein